MSDRRYLLAFTKVCQSRKKMDILETCPEYSSAMDANMFKILLIWVMDLATMMVSWNRDYFSFSYMGWRSHSSWLHWRRMEMFIYSRRVPSNDASQDKTLNAAGSKYFLGVRLPVHNASSILWVI